MLAPSPGTNPAPRRPRSRVRAAIGTFLNRDERLEVAQAIRAVLAEWRVVPPPCAPA